MKLLDLYKDILKMGWMTVDEDGLISMSSRLNADDKLQASPDLKGIKTRRAAWRA